MTGGCGSGSARNQLPIFRDAIPDADKIGQSDDPWTYTLLIAMKDDDACQLKFSTSSVGGANAVRQACFENGSGNAISTPTRCRSWRSARTATSTRFTGPKVQFPVFEIVDWDYWDEADRASAAALPSWATADDPRTQIRDELEDEIPY